MLFIIVLILEFKININLVGKIINLIFLTFACFVVLDVKKCHFLNDVFVLLGNDFLGCQL